MKDFIEPSLGSGFRDYLPKDMIPRQKMLDAIRAVFERYGFMPLDTPGIEREEILTGGDAEFKKQIFRIDRDGGDEFALRFDLTVPLARVISMNRDLERPFKRYQTGKVWRGERPQAGRFREFVQFDADIVGSSSTLADAEIISLAYATLAELGIEKFLIRVNNRKILNGLSAFAGFPDTALPDVLRALDKLDKIGWDGVAEELKGKAGLSDEQIPKLRQFIEVRADTQDETLSKAEALLAGSPRALEGIAELRKIRAELTGFGVPDNAWVIDLSIARGLGYYTGTVFETVLTDLPAIGSVFSGGRYDGLVSRFSDQSVPATGASVGVDRLFAAMEQLNLLKPAASVSSALVLNFDSAAEQSALKAVAALRAAGIPSEIYLGKEQSLKEQLGYALRREIPIVVIIGEQEQSRGVAQIKHLPSRTQLDVPLESIASSVKELLAQGAQVK